ncbi:MAG: hypothetical protein EOO13_09790 [Chitinophagaceae bacterium]|nr:MAG: hypothetical protein EOO13_09790 [Chitinophagaceae bacterium]
MSKLLKNFNANTAQLRAMISLGWCTQQYLIWPRGVGKSFYIGWVMIMISRLMPGSKWTFLGPSYAKMFADIIPGIKGALARFGYFEGIHYVCRKTPPKNMNLVLPWEGPDEWDNSLLFFHKERCTVFQLSSQEGNDRGRSVDGFIMDEGLLLNKEKLDSNTNATNRGNNDRYGHVPLHHGIIVCSSMPYQQNHWLLQKEELRDQIAAKKKKNKLDPKIFYDEANIYENLDILGVKYIIDNQNSLSSLAFETEIMNIRPRTIENGFYPNLTDEHEYEHKYTYSFLNSLQDNAKWDLDSRSDADCFPNKPLDLGMDYGSRICSLVIGQEQGQVFKFIKDMYVKSPGFIDDLVKKFTEYYKYHRCKEVNLYTDHPGNTKLPNSTDTFAEHTEKKLREAGWKVFRYSFTANKTYHKDKYFLWTKLFLRQDYNLPAIEFNKYHCKHLLISMRNAPVKDGVNGIEKDKKSEKSITLAQEEATHLSDAADMIMFYKYRKALRKEQSFAPNLMM